MVQSAIDLHGYQIAMNFQKKNGQEFKKRLSEIQKNVLEKGSRGRKVQMIPKTELLK